VCPCRNRAGLVVIFKEKSIPSDSVKAILPFAKSLLKSMDVKATPCACSPEIQMLKLKNHIEMTIFFTNPLIRLFNTDAVCLSDGHNIIFIKRFFFQFL